MSTEQNTMATMVRAFAEIIERMVKRFDEQGADHEREMAEHRASFGARTEADRKIIEGLRTAADEQVLSASKVAYVLRCAGETPVQAAQRVVKERDGLLTQVQDQRAEIERLRNDERKAYQDGEALRAEVADLRGIVDMVHASLGIKRGDHIGNAIAQLKAQTPKRSHPVAVGEYLRRLTGFSTTPAGEVAQVLHVDCDAPTTEYTVKRPNGQQGVWSESGCEPCDPPADHDTTAGKKAAEAVIRDFRSGDAAFSPIEIKGALFDDKTVIVSREPDSYHGSRIVITDKDDMGEANIYLTESGARQMATALIGLCDVRKVPQ